MRGSLGSRALEGAKRQLEIVTGIGVSGPQLEASLVVPDGLGDPANREERIRKVQLRLRKIGTKPERSLEMRDGLELAALLRKQVREVEFELFGVGVHAKRLPVFAEILLGSARRRTGKGAPLQRARKTDPGFAAFRPDAQCVPIIALALRDLSPSLQQAGQVIQSLPAVRLDVEGAAVVSQGLVPVSVQFAQDAEIDPGARKARLYRKGGTILLLRRGPVTRPGKGKRQVVMRERVRREAAHGVPPEGDFALENHVSAGRRPAWRSLTASSHCPTGRPVKPI